MTSPEERCRLYLVSPAKIDLPAFADQLSAALKGGDVACFQLRLKDSPDEEVLEAASLLLPICRGKGVEFLVNDRPDLAKQSGADGVHLGRQDAGIREAREMLGFEATIGATCHGSRHLAFEAGDAGADYVAFGAFFPTKTKKVEHRAKPEILEWWSGLAEIPCVAIGGITPDNCAPLIEAGADFLAVSSAVWNHPRGPEAAVAAFNKLFSKHTRKVRPLAD